MGPNSNDRCSWKRKAEGTVRHKDPQGQGLVKRQVGTEAVLPKPMNTRGHQTRGKEGFSPRVYRGNVALTAPSEGEQTSGHPNCEKINSFCF